MSKERKVRKFVSEEELFTAFDRIDLLPSSKIAIVAGHYMLMYDDAQQCLVPMVAKDTTNPRVAKLSNNMAGTYPCASFEMGAALARATSYKGIESHIALIVDDHHYTTPAWRSQNLPPDISTSELRHQFFRSKSVLPPSFLSILSRHGMSESMILDNSDPGREEAEILPRRSLVFSEAALRRRFDRTSRKVLEDLGFLTKVTSPDGIIEYKTSPQVHEYEFCLTDGGTCACSGELLQLLMTLASTGHSTIVLIVPEECSQAVELGGRLFLRLPNVHRHCLESIILVHGFHANYSRESPDDNLRLVQLSP